MLLALPRTTPGDGPVILHNDRLRGLLGPPVAYRDQSNWSVIPQYILTPFTVVTTTTTITHDAHDAHDAHNDSLIVLTRSYTGPGPT